jgi:hypothetical protein
MGNVVEFQRRDRKTREELKTDICELIDEGAVVLAIVHGPGEQKAIFSNLVISENEMLVKGVMFDGMLGLSQLCAESEDS